MRSNEKMFYCYQEYIFIYCENFIRVYKEDSHKFYKYYYPKEDSFKHDNNLSYDDFVQKCKVFILEDNM